MQKPGRNKGKDPRAKKARDNAKRTTRRDRIAESAARKIKAHGNQTVRRAGKVPVRAAADFEESADISPKAARRTKVLRVWPAENASERRKDRDAERAYLDATAKTGPKGRQRSSMWRNLRATK